MRAGEAVVGPARHQLARERLEQRIDLDAAHALARSAADRIVTFASATSAPVPSNGGTPASISYDDHAEREQIGAVIDRPCRVACSGAM